MHMMFDQILEYFKPVFNKEYRNINTHSDAVPELPHGTVAGSALCAYRYNIKFDKQSVDIIGYKPISQGYSSRHTSMILSMNPFLLSVSPDTPK